MRDDVVAVVHVAGEPAPYGPEFDFESQEGRIVQPCERCGILLREFNTRNPPSTPIPWVEGDTSCVSCGAPAGRHHDGQCPEIADSLVYAWWSVGENVAEAYADGEPITFPHSLAQIAEDHLLDYDVALCDPEDVPDGAQTFTPVQSDESGDATSSM